MKRLFKFICSTVTILMVMGLFMAMIPSKASEAKTRKTSESAPSPGNTFVLFKGTFKTDERQAALDRINDRSK